MSSLNLVSGVKGPEQAIGHKQGLFQIPMSNVNHSTSRIVKPRSLLFRLKTWLNNIWKILKLAYMRYIEEGLLLRSSAERFYKVFGGHLFFQTLYAACEFDLFTLLDNHKRLSAKEIAALLEIQEQPCRIMLLGLIASGLLKKRGLFYKNTVLSRRLLCKTSPKNVISYVKLQHHLMYKAVYSFYESVKSNTNIGLKTLEGDEPTVYQRLSHQPKLEQLFQDAMQELSVQTNEFLTKFVDFSKVHHLIDVGGGDGTNIIEISKQQPSLSATVYDLPGAVEIAQKNIQNHGLAGRLSAVEGNAFKDRFPIDADCFLFCHFFTIWSKEEDLMLLKKAYEALPSGGRVIIYNMMQNDDEKGPLSAAVGSPYFLSLATGKGMLYTWNEYETLFKEAGFTQVSRKVLPRDHGIIVGVKP